MDGGATVAQRRVLVRLLVLAALSLPVAGALGALPGEAVWRLSDRAALAGNAASAGAGVLLVLALVVGSSGLAGGARVLDGDVRMATVAAGVVVAGSAAWLALSLVFDLGLFAAGLPDVAFAAVLGRRVGGLAIGLTAASAALVAWWTASVADGSGDDG